MHRRPFEGRHLVGPDPASYAGHIRSLYYGALGLGLLRGARTAMGDLEDTFSEGTALQPVQRPGRIKAVSPNLHSPPRRWHDVYKAAGYGEG